MRATEELYWLVDSTRRMARATLREHFSEEDRPHAARELAYLLEGFVTELREEKK